MPSGALVVHRRPRAARAKRRRPRLAPLAAHDDSEDELVQEPLLPSRYSPEAITRACGRRPSYVLSRGREVLARCSKWLFTALTRGDAASDDASLAGELRSVLEDLGPSFVKLGQMLASRVDLLPPVYIAELRQLTDHVEPFSVEEAEAVLKAEWRAIGANSLVEMLLEQGLPDRPFAAASLCQVYRLDLDGYGTVAVKVQRPGIRGRICADLFLFRQLASLAARWLDVPTDLLALVDEYGSRLVDEVDFALDARNALEFQVSAARLGLDSVCTVAQPVVDLTSRTVLVTSWVHGESLDRVASRDPGEARRLLGVALTTYLSMLLDTGALHADPHVGNLLRATDGRLVILDWGLVARVNPTLRRRLLTYVAHVLAQDYKAIPQDLVDLGFIPPGRGGAVDDEVVALGISEIFRQLASGGSVRRRVADVLPILSDIRKRYGNVGQIPAAFFYILRTFSMLEGFGLRLDKDYRIVDDCFPYLASWATRAQGPEARSLLRTVLYGPGEHGVPDAAQIRTLSHGLAAHLRQAAAEPRSMHGIEEEEEDVAATAVVMEEAARVADVLFREALETAAWASGSPSTAAAVPPRTAAERALLASLGDLAGAVATGAAETGQAASAGLAGEFERLLAGRCGGPTFPLAARTAEIFLRKAVETAAWALGDPATAVAASMPQGQDGEEDREGNDLLGALGELASRVLDPYRLEADPVKEAEPLHLVDIGNSYAFPPEAVTFVD